MKKIFFSLLAVAVICFAAIAYAQTYRLGSDAITYNAHAVVTKTAAYTLTSSDGEVRFACSSVNIVATLPSIASLSPGTQTYKIVKSDSTAYAVVVTPATGDTIGGEAQRYIIAQNSYMVISKGANGNWIVNFESPYIAEDHSAGTSAAAVTGNTSITGTLAASGNTTLSGTLAVTGASTLTGTVTAANKLHARAGGFTNTSTTGFYVNGHLYEPYSTAAAGRYLKYK